MQIKESSRGRLAAHMSDVPKKVAARFDRNNGLASHVIDVHGSFSNFTKFYRYFFFVGVWGELTCFLQNDLNQVLFCDSGDHVKW